MCCLLNIYHKISVLIQYNTYQKISWTFVLTIAFSLCLVGQCPQPIWNTSNLGGAYVDDIGNKTIFGDFSNTREGQYVNDGHLYFFGDITNDGFIGDGQGDEYIKTCDTTTTLISGGGYTEFNRLDVDNPRDIILKKDIRIVENLNFENGLIHTDRNVFRERVFFADGAEYTNVSDERHIDGAVSRQGAGPFIYPVGDGDHMSRIKAEGVNPFDIFVTTYHSILQDQNQFNSKGAFSPILADLDISKVQDKEFWTLSGGQSTTVTLFWTEFSDIYNLVSDVNDLVVVGWDGEKWVNLGNTETIEIFNTGTVTSSNIMPDRYDAFTFGVADSDADGYVDSEDVAPLDPCLPDASSPACTNNSTCIDVELSVYLEGPLQSGKIGEYNDEMRTLLNRYGYLPGQRPTTLLGTATPPAQPYYVSPWLYDGQEGLEFNAFASGGSNIYPPDVVDYVYISIRTTPEVLTTVCTKAALLMSDGNIEMTEAFDCCDLTEQAYYILIEHRNHLPVMSPRPVPIENGVMSFDFRANQSYTRLLGDGQKEISEGVYVMYAGNGDQTLASASLKDINANDLSKWTEENGDHSGYYFQDYDLNGDVNVHDKAIWLTNNGVFTDVDR